MTERELRKKIVEITISTVWKDSYGDEVVIDRVAAEQLADALIASGYVVDLPALIDGKMGIFVPDKGCMELYPVSIKEQLAGANHRAEVAEKAARDLIAYYCGYTIENDIDNSLSVALQQAEKELAEEKKSDC